MNFFYEKTGLLSSLGKELYIYLFSQWNTLYGNDQKIKLSG